MTKNCDAYGQLSYPESLYHKPNFLLKQVQNGNNYEEILYMTQFLNTIELCSIIKLKDSYNLLQ